MLVTLGRDRTAKTQASASTNDDSLSRQVLQLRAELAAIKGQLAQMHSQP